MQNLKISTFPIYKNFTLPMSKKHYKKRIPVIAEFISYQDADVIALQGVTPLMRDGVVSYLENYFFLSDESKENHYNGFLVKKGVPVITYQTYSLGENKNIFGTNSFYPFSPKTCTTLTLSLDGENVTIFNTQLDRFSHQARKKEIKNLERITKLSFHEGSHIILGDFQMDINGPLFALQKRNHLTNATISLGSSKVKKEGNATSHIFLTDELSYCDPQKASASKNGVLASDYYALSTAITLKKTR